MRVKGNLSSLAASAGKILAETNPLSLGAVGGGGGFACHPSFYSSLILFPSPHIFKLIFGLVFSPPK